MQASKVHLSAETLQAMNRPMTSDQRYALRRQRAIDFIKSKPTGTKLSIGDICRAAGVYPSSSQNFFMNKMKADGTLTQHKNLDDLFGSWTVNEDVKTSLMPSLSSDFKAPRSLTLDPPPQEKDIVGLAKDYYWQTSSDSLREFIKWLDTKEL